MKEFLFDAHFPEIDLGVCDVSTLGLPHCFVSVFDHWLNEQEAETCKWMSYSIAAKSGNLGFYLQGENKFMELYETLGRHGVLCKHPRPLREFKKINAELEQVFLDSLRETRFMDVYFMGYGARILGGYDRTDMAVADSPERLVALSSEVSKSGLFLLPALVAP